MTILAIVVAITTILLTIYSVLKPGRILAIYAISRPIIQPFIFLQYKLSIIPYSIIWALILPATYAINSLRGGWRFLCYKSAPLLVILILALMSFAYTVDVKASVEGLFKLVTVFCAFGIAYNSVKSYRDADNIINSVIFASFIPMLFGFYQVVTGNYDQIHAAVVERVNSVFGVGNAYGIFLSISICAALMMLLRKNLAIRARTLFISLLSLMVVSQILALNRGTWLALSSAVIIALFPYRRKVTIRWFIIGATIIAVAFSGIIYNRFTEESYNWAGDKRDTFKGRVEYWQRMVPLILERPILGYGVGTTGEIRDENGLLPPHNDYVRLAADIGIPGSIVYSYFLISLALFYLRRRNDYRDVLLRYNFPMAVLSSYIVIISMTQNIIYNLTNFVFFMILNGAVIKLNILTRRHDLLKQKSSVTPVVSVGK
ncbi:MAG: O-antigen ligase family protein [Candidatus Thiodiazotropha sp. (ex Epidulcina cf. delphinae)]|nr:O-antigen ligase family protein [Candidatus Thiodiazotropha sp. (ex Epidulcina cf. delphinae)]